jgi:hypothetical protein
MGMSAFARARREMSAVEKVEAERFKAVKDAGGIRAQDDVRAEADKLLPAAAEAQEQALKNIGEKALAPNDEALRNDHAAEIAGRNIEGVHLPKDPVERVTERVPSATQNEKLVPLTSVDSEGPSPALLKAVAKETGTEGIEDQARTVPDADPNAPVSTTGDEVIDGPQVAIPDDWEELHAPEMKDLARNFTKRQVNTKAEAEIVIRRELKKRG